MAAEIQLATKSTYFYFLAVSSWGSTLLEGPLYNILITTPKLIRCLVKIIACFDSIL